MSSSRPLRRRAARSRRLLLALRSPSPVARAAARRATRCRRRARFRRPRRRPQGAPARSRGGRRVRLSEVDGRRPAARRARPGDALRARSPVAAAGAAPPAPRRRRPRAATARAGSARSATGPGDARSARVRGGRQAAPRALGRRARERHLRRPDHRALPPRRAAPAPTAGAHLRASARTPTGGELSDWSNLAGARAARAAGAARAALARRAKPERRRARLARAGRRRAIAGYNVYRRDADAHRLRRAGRHARRRRRAATSTLGVAYGQRYIYTVSRARHSEAAWSESALGRRARDRLPGPLRAAAARRALGAAAASARSACVWEASPDPDVAGYVVERADPDAEFHRVNAEPVAALEFTDRGLSSGFTFRYRVAAIDKSGQSRPAGRAGRDARAVSAAYKVSGGGNDFLALVEPEREPTADEIARGARAACRSAPTASSPCAATARPARVRMSYWNADGHPAALCINGTRCAARLALDLGWARGPTSAIDDRRRHLRGTRRRPATEIALAAAGTRGARRAGAPWRSAARAHEGWFVTVGVPHFVLLWPESLAHAPVATLGAALRRHPEFAPGGTNVDFVRFPDAAPDGDPQLRARRRGRDARLRHRRPRGDRRRPRSSTSPSCPLAARTLGGFTLDGRRPDSRRRRCATGRSPATPASSAASSSPPKPVAVPPPPAWSA